MNSTTKTERLDSAKTESSKDRLRRLTLGRAPQFRHKVIDYYPPKYQDILNEEGTVVGLEHVGFEDEPIKVEVRQPTVKERNELIKSCRGKDGKFDEMEFILQAAIRFVYDPVSGDRLYSKEDYDALSQQPAGDFVDQFGGEAVELLTLGERTKDSPSSRKMLATKTSTD